ncbi:MAG TPA: prolyl oligopeptidase family serine peptidase, partial [Terriglobales bacterium]|nr:prolyl oligopeptidase family serine peptidase [Terriglobales bacterium]
YPCAVSASAAVCVAAGPASPPSLESIDLTSGKRKVLFDPNSQLRSAYHPRIRFLRWNIGDGLEAGGVLILPSQSPHAPVPLYINYYTCDGFLRGGTGDEWPIPQLLEAGYAVACVNSVALPGPQEGVRNYEVALKVVRTLVDKLSNDGIIDRSKIAMGGLSFGSEVALWVAAHSHLLAVLSISSGQLEPSDYWLGTMPGSDIPATRRRVWGLGSPEETPARWQIVSPALNADKIRIPVLLQLPEQESRNIAELYSRLYQEGTPTELYAFPDEAHIKIQPRHRLAAYERNLDWFRYWIEDARDSNPAKADQYRRWDKLRNRWRPLAPSATSEAKTPVQPSH